MARCAILLALIGICCTSLALAKDIDGYNSADESWMLEEAAEDSSMWGFRYVDLGWDDWEVMFDSKRIIKPRELQNPESSETVDVMAEVLLIFTAGHLEMVMFDIADSEKSYRRLARVFSDYYDDADNTQVVNMWNHRVWVDDGGDSVIVNRYIDLNGKVRTRMAYLTPAMSAQLAGEAKPEWFTQLMRWIERRR